MIKSYKDLDIWKKGIELVKAVYVTVDKFPDSELYGLVSQMKRSAVSIPSNVAEGFRRQHPKDFKRFLTISLGSLAELETQVVIAKDLKYLNEADEAALAETIDHISRMISNLMKRL